jgi:hypothetical protein
MLSDLRASTEFSLVAAMLKHPVLSWVGVVLGFVLAVSTGQAQDAQAQTQAKARMQAQISALAAEKETRTPGQQKMASMLIRAERQRRTGRASEAAPMHRNKVKVKADGTVLVDMRATVSAALRAEIERAGGRVVSQFARERAIRAEVPLGAIEALASRGDVQFIEPAQECATNAGSVTSEGDVAHRANLVRNQFGVMGAGVKVGVLSDSVDFLTPSQQSGDLPSVTVLPGEGGNGDGEGTAMLEIVHDLAPAAQLFFATGFNGAASMANNIRDLAAAGCKVIIDDVNYFFESPFQDDVISLAVNDVSAQGVLYFSSARNSGNKNDGTASTWEGDFVNGGDFGGNRGQLLNFGGGMTENTCIDGSSQGRVDLFWADPLGASNNDYDLYIVDSGGNILDSSDATQNGRQNPYENVGEFNFGERIVVTKFRGEARFIHVDAGRTGLAITTAGCVRGHNASGAANAFSVAASSAEGRTTPFPGGASSPVETFSSDGPRRIFFQPNGNAITPGNFSSTGGTVLLKPDFTAADGNVTTLPPSTGLNPFFGTSSAAPHAGAIAALVISANPVLTPAQVRTILTNATVDIEAPGFDRDSGAGLLNAYDAVLSVVGNKPNLAPTTPGGWSAPVVVSVVAGTNTDSAVIGPANTLLLDLAVQNRGTATTGAGFTIKIFVDDVEQFSTNAGSLAANATITFTDVNLGMLPVGAHTVRLRIDTADAIDEFNEGDNVFTKTIFVTSGAAPQLVKSSYDGVIAPINGETLDFARLGFFTMKIGSQNTFTAKLSLGTDRFGLKGSIDATGEASFREGRQEVEFAVLERKDRSQISFDFSLGPLGAGNQALGIFTDQVGDLYTVMIADRAAYSAKRNPPAPFTAAPAELIGRYTALASVGQAALPASLVPGGFGIAAASVDKGGKVRIVGRLADGVSFSHAAPLSALNTVPLHVLIGKKKEILNGLVRFRDTPGVSDFDASDLAWVKLPDRRAPAYSSGWETGITSNVIGSRYERAPTDPALPFLTAVDADGNARLAFTGGGVFPTTITAALNIDERDKVEIVGNSPVDGLKLKLSAKSGTFSGLFRNPATDKKTKYVGVIFDKQSLGSGFFSSDDQTGAVVLETD